jgi:hypothetical protein
VSIVVLNHNYAHFLPLSIESALAQVSCDVEVVVVDDGSTDGSVDVIRGFDGIAPVIKDNGGQASAMNAGFAASTGDVVIFLDADDVLFPTAARDVAAEMSAHPDAAWVMYRLRLIDAEGHESQHVRPRRPGVMPHGDLRRHVARYRCFHWQPTSGNAFARWALDPVMPVPEADYRISADAYLATVMPLVGTIRSVDAVLGGYRVHGKSNFTSGPVDERYFRDQVRRQIVNHEHGRRVAAHLQVEWPADVRQPRDAAFLSFRLAALLHDPQQPAMPGDRRRGLAARGVAAALTNPLLPWPNRLRRAGWFLAAAAPGERARQWAMAHAPDTPAGRAQLAAQRQAAPRVRG